MSSTNTICLTLTGRDRLKKRPRTCLRMLRLMFVPKKMRLRPELWPPGRPPAPCLLRHASTACIAPTDTILGLQGSDPWSSPPACQSTPSLDKRSKSPTPCRMRFSSKESLLSSRVGAQFTSDGTGRPFGCVPSATKTTSMGVSNIV